MADLLHPPGLDRVTVHKSAPLRRVAVILILGIMYAVSGYMVFTTIGEPHRIALEAAERAEDERFAALGKADADGADEGISVEAAARAASERGAAFNAAAVEELDETDESEEIAVEASGLSDAGAASGGAAHVASSQATEADEFETAEPAQRKTKRKSSKKTISVAEMIEVAAREAEFGEQFHSKHLPSVYMPDAWALAALCVSIASHLMFHFLCRWLLWFKAMTLFEPSRRMGA
jgi:hypothetical protein